MSSVVFDPKQKRVGGSQAYALNGPTFGARTLSLGQSGQAGDHVNFGRSAGPTNNFCNPFTWIANIFKSIFGGGSSDDGDNTVSSSSSGGGLPASSVPVSTTVAAPPQVIEAAPAPVVAETRREQPARVEAEETTSAPSGDDDEVEAPKGKKSDRAEAEKKEEHKTYFKGVEGLKGVSNDAIAAEVLNKDRRVAAIDDEVRDIDAFTARIDDPAAAESAVRTVRQLSTFLLTPRRLNAGSLQDITNVAHHEPEIIKRLNALKDKNGDPIIDPTEGDGKKVVDALKSIWQRRINNPTDYRITPKEASAFAGVIKQLAVGFTKDGKASEDDITRSIFKPNNDMNDPALRLFKGYTHVDTHGTGKVATKESLATGYPAVIGQLKPAEYGAYWTAVNAASSTVTPHLLSKEGRAAYVAQKIDPTAGVPNDGRALDTDAKREAMRLGRLVVEQYEKLGNPNDKDEKKRPTAAAQEAHFVRPNFINGMMVIAAARMKDTPTPTMPNLGTLNTSMGLTGNTRYEFKVHTSGTKPNESTFLSFDPGKVKENRQQVQNALNDLLTGRGELLERARKGESLGLAQREALGLYMALSSVLTLAQSSKLGDEPAKCTGIYSLPNLNTRMRKEKDDYGLMLKNLMGEVKLKKVGNTSLVTLDAETMGKSKTKDAIEKLVDLVTDDTRGINLAQVWSAPAYAPLRQVFQRNALQIAGPGSSGMKVDSGSGIVSIDTKKDIKKLLDRSINNKIKADPSLYFDIDNTRSDDPILKEAMVKVRQALDSADFTKKGIKLELEDLKDVKKGDALTDDVKKENSRRLIAYRVLDMIQAKLPEDKTPSDGVKNKIRAYFNAYEHTDAYAATP